MSAPRIEIESAMSLYVEGLRQTVGSEEWTQILEGTAFLAHDGEQHLLVTNIHVLTGAGAETGVPIGDNVVPPRIIRVWHPWGDIDAMHWLSIDYPLYDDHGQARWLVHPTHPTYDIAALPIHDVHGVHYMPYSLDPVEQPFRLMPSSDLSIIGFPFGTSSHPVEKIPIWNRATIASELDLDYAGKPMLLVDSRSRPGQSGSPVVAKRTDIAVLDNGDVKVGYDLPAELVGLYSGRINDQSDLGMVWKTPAVREVVHGGARSTFTYY